MRGNDEFVQHLLMNRRALVCVATLVAVASPSIAAPDLFPKDVIDAGGGAGFAERLEEPAFWPSSATNQYRQRVRLFIGGHTVNSWGIRIDQNNSGKAFGYFVEHDGKKIVEDRRFRVSDADLAELQRLAEEAELWTIYPQFYVMREDEVCIDGMMIILERRTATNYSYSEGNAQCTLGRSQLAVAAKMMEMAGRPGLKSLLP